VEVLFTLGHRIQYYWPDLVWNAVFADGFSRFAYIYPFNGIVLLQKINALSIPIPFFL
jgi:hypothetical protein